MFINRGNAQWGCILADKTNKSNKTRDTDPEIKTILGFIGVGKAKAVKVRENMF